MSARPPSASAGKKAPPKVSLQVPLAAGGADKTAGPLSPMTPASPPASPVSPPPAMTMVLREKNVVRLAKFSDGEVTDIKTIVEAVDVSECNVAFQPSGSMFAFADASTVSLVDSRTGEVLHKIAVAKVVHLLFSPSGTYLATFSHPDPKGNDGGNACVYRVAGGELLTRWLQPTWPCIMWSCDEEFCIRPGAAVLRVFDGKQEGKEPLDSAEIQLPREKQFEYLPSLSDHPLLAVFKPHHKQAQASLRVHRLPNLKEDMLNLNYGRAEGASLQWSKSGTLLSVVLRMESDKSNQSYYGTSSLVVVNVRDRSSVNIQLTAGEGIHDIQWSPTNDEFILVHGIMPKNKATLYNSKVQPVCTFGEAPRNSILWAPNGKFFALGGSGNLAGEYQFYDRDAVGKTSQAGEGARLGYFSEKSSVQLWSPDSRYLMCATIFSRLRIDNKLVMWKHNGARVSERKFSVLEEASWVPVDASKFTARAPSPTVAPVERPKSGAYRPPVASAAAAALLARAPVGAVGQVKAAGPVGGQVVDSKKKVKR